MDWCKNLKPSPPASWCPSPCGQPGESIQDRCVTDPSFLIMRWRSCIACFNGCCCQVSNITTISFILFITTTRLESKQLAVWCLPFFSSFPSSHSGSMMSLSWGNKSLLLGHWYEIMALYYVKSILTEISTQDRRVLQKNKVIEIKFLSIWGNATDV